MNYHEVKFYKITPTPYNRSVSGYGSKLPTQYMVKLDNENRWKRLYAICYSNVASFYVLNKNVKQFIRDDFVEEVKRIRCLY